MRGIVFRDTFEVGGSLFKIIGSFRIPDHDYA